MKVAVDGLDQRLFELEADKPREKPEFRDLAGAGRRLHQGDNEIDPVLLDAEDRERPLLAEPVQRAVLALQRRDHFRQRPRSLARMLAAWGGPLVIPEHLPEPPQIPLARRKSYTRSLGPPSRRQRSARSALAATPFVKSL